MPNRSFHLFCAVACGLLVGACAKQKPEPIIRVRADASFTAERGREALERFSPAREAVVEGGECVGRAMPRQEITSLAVFFPSRAKPDTHIAILLDSAGKVLRYNETRGIPSPNTDRAALQAETTGLTRTIIQLDYITGQAFAANAGPGQDGTGVVGLVTEFEGSEVLGDLRARASRVMELCDSGEPRRGM